MSADKDGGSAFPHEARNETQPGGEWGETSIHIPASSGMSLRDYFAAHVAGGLVVGAAGMLGTTFSVYAKGPCDAAVANRAYALAAVLLAERAKATAAEIANDKPCTNFRSDGRGACRNCGHFHGPAGEA